MRMMFVGFAALAAAGCASQAQFQLDSEGYYALELPMDASGNFDTEKVGAMLAEGEVACQKQGKTAETGFGIRENAVILRYRCVDPASVQK